MPEPEIEKIEETKEKQDLPPLETKNETDVFEKTDDVHSSGEFERIIDDAITEKENEINPEIKEQENEKQNNEKTDDDEKNDEDVLVEADGDAIERALKKHKDTDEDLSLIHI